MESSSLKSESNVEVTLRAIPPRSAGGSNLLPFMFNHAIRVKFKQMRLNCFCLSEHTNQNSVIIGVKPHQSAPNAPDRIDTTILVICTKYHYGIWRYWTSHQNILFSDQKLSHE